jgi:hypothetical protein
MNSVQTQSVIPSPQLPPPPSVLLNRLLLTETCSVTSLVPRSNLAPDLLTVRATKVSVLLEEILRQQGYWHGGINE